MYRLGVVLNITRAVLSSSAVVRRLCHRSHSASSLVVRRQPGLVQRLYSTSYQPFSSSVNAEPFLDGTSAVYVEQLYEDWLQDPTTVHKVSSRSSTRRLTNQLLQGRGEMYSMLYVFFAVFGVTIYQSINQFIYFRLRSPYKPERKIGKRQTETF